MTLRVTVLSFRERSRLRARLENLKTRLARPLAPAVTMALASVVRPATREPERRVRRGRPLMIALTIRARCLKRC